MVTETKVVQDADDAVILEEMLTQAKSSNDPSLTKQGEVLSKGTSTLSPTVIREIKGNEYVILWDMQTGEATPVHRNHLPTQLKKKIPAGEPNAGERAFTSSKPNFEPRRGTYKCLLHPDSEDRKHYDELGLPVCRKSNLISPMQVELHMKHRHNQSWLTIEKERLDKEKKEEREFQRSLITMASQKGVSTPPTTVKRRVRKKREDKHGTN